MYFDSFSDFIAMDGHGPYVWTCYGIALVVIAFNVISPLLKKREFMAEQTRRLHRQRRAAAKEG